MSSSSISKILKFFLRLFILVGVVRVLIVEAAENGGGKVKTIGINVGNTQHRVELNMGRTKNRALSKLDINFTSKRRIPNGPDPIHNRRAGSSHHPPGQA